MSDSSGQDAETFQSLGMMQAALHLEPLFLRLPAFFPLRVPLKFFSENRCEIIRYCFQQGNIAGIIVRLLIGRHDIADHFIVIDNGNNQCSGDRDVPFRYRKRHIEAERPFFLKGLFPDAFPAFPGK
ncbi:MAG: hypothetical protein A4E66_02229 [Syntrophus sp. PtaB.Bin001]|nr:MAG: hypothetical protein A4E66_02229 [Syntrophus sp. PtaB.Bin001]